MSRWGPPLKTKTVRAVRGAPHLTAGKQLERWRRGPNDAIMEFVWREIEQSALPYPKARTRAFKEAAQRFPREVRSIQRLWKQREAVFLGLKVAEAKQRTLERSLMHFAKQCEDQQNKLDGLGQSLLRQAERQQEELQRLAHLFEKVATTK